MHKHANDGSMTSVCIFGSHLGFHFELCSSMPALIRQLLFTEITPGFKMVRKMAVNFGTRMHAELSVNA